MLKHLRAIWNLPKHVEFLVNEQQCIAIDLANFSKLLEDKLPNGLGLTEQDRLMIREVHNWITTRLQGYLRSESDRIGQEALAKMMAHEARNTIIDKGERLNPKEDFNDDDIPF